MLDEESIPNYDLIQNFKILIGSIDLIHLNLADCIRKDEADDEHYITQNQLAAIGFHLCALGLLAEQSYRSYGDEARAEFLGCEIADHQNINHINSLIKGNVRATLSEIINTNQMLIGHFEQSASSKPFEMPMGTALMGYQNVLQNIRAALSICLQNLTSKHITHD